MNSVEIDFLKYLLITFKSDVSTSSLTLLKVLQSFGGLNSNCLGYRFFKNFCLLEFLCCVK